MREGEGGGGELQQAGVRGKAEMECVGVFVLRWQGLKSGEERVSSTVSGVLSL